jgi:ketosteroid isomerase-like protein
MTDNGPDVLEQHIRGLYRAFNERDIEAVLSGLREDVVWANGMEGGHVLGRDGVRDYWTRQFREVRSTVEPQRIEPAAGGRVAVDVHQVVQSPDGAQLLADTTVRHLFTFTDGLVSRFDIE